MSNLAEKISAQVSQAVKAIPRSSSMDQIQQWRDTLSVVREAPKSVTFDIPVGKEGATGIRNTRFDYEGMPRLVDEEDDGIYYPEHSDDERYEKDWSDQSSLASSDSGQDVMDLAELPVLKVPPEPFDDKTFCADVDESKFRLQGKRYMLTYKTHLDKKEYKAWLEELAKRKCTIEMAHESGDKSHNYLHTHVVVDFGKAFCSTNVRVFDYKGIHPNIKKIQSKKHWDRAQVYLSKEDPANGHLAQKNQIENWVEAVWACETRQQAALLASKPAEIVGVLQAFDIKKREQKDPLADFLPRYWQVAIKNWLLTDPDPRKIKWLYDPWGACGKTMFLKHLLATMPHSVAFAKQTGGARDFSTVVQTAFDSGWDGKIFIFDFVRDMEDHKFYEPLEAVKDGLITALKYRGQSFGFDSPHILVFANFLPEVDRLSLDRWDVYEIIHNYRDAAGGPLPQADGQASPDVAALNINMVRQRRNAMRAKDDPFAAKK